VAFGDKIAFEDTLDESLDALFGGDSGADAGDGGTIVPDDGTTTPPDTGTGTTPPPSTGGGSTGTDQTALDAALADAKSALADRTAAYASNDVVAAAEADQRLQAAIEAALAASGE
jgi:uncharacterized membrane protein (UPF0182 family)